MTDEEMGQLMDYINEEIKTAFYNVIYCDEYIKSKWRLNHLTDGNIKDLEVKLEQVASVLKGMIR